MGLKAYLLVKTKDDLTQEQFLRAVNEVEDIPGVEFADPVIGTRDMVIMVDAPITVEALAKKTAAMPWVRELEVLQIVSIFERHKTARIHPGESLKHQPAPALLRA